MNSWINLEGKTAVVTGAGSGIGRAVAVELGRVGCRIFALDLNADAAEETASLVTRESGAPALAAGADTTDEAAVRAAAEKLRESFGGADVLVNNAGIVGHGTLAETDIEEWKRVLDVNVTGYLVCSREFGSDMVERGSGSIVNITSICALHPLTGNGAYSPSKAAVDMFSRQLAAEWAPYGVRSNAIAPGLIRTPLTEPSYADDQARKARESLVPLGRVGDPSDIANTVVWLASERSWYVTGQQLAVDGGLGQALYEPIKRTSAH